MNNWDLYEKVEARDFDGLKKKLKKLYNTFPVTVVQWGQTSLGTPYAVIKADRAVGDRAEETPKPEIVDGSGSVVKRTVPKPQPQTTAMA